MAIQGRSMTHYPKSKKDGGIETVSICSNCHRAFHYYSHYGVYYGA